MIVCKSIYIKILQQYQRCYPMLPICYLVKIKILEQYQRCYPMLLMLPHLRGYPHPGFFIFNGLYTKNAWQRVEYKRAVVNLLKMSNMSNLT